MKTRLVIAGFGDTGILVAIHLMAMRSDVEIIGISPKPCLVSGQELGLRLTQSTDWQHDYLMPFSRFEKLDAVETLHGKISSIDTDTQRVAYTSNTGESSHVEYDILLIASGVTNGFWRTAKLEDMDHIKTELQARSDALSKASSIAVIGGGASGVSLSYNLAKTYPHKDVDLFFSGDEPLPGYHPKVRRTFTKDLQQVGVNLHPGHRAILPDEFSGDDFTTDPIKWSTGQDPVSADLTVWTVGQLKPNNSFIPPNMLDEHGYVKTDAFLRVPEQNNIYTVGDIAASDPNRSSARNEAYKLVAHNINCEIDKTPDKMKPYKASPVKWGSVLGVQDHGLKVSMPNGSVMRFPRKFTDKILYPVIVRKLMYKGIRPFREQSET